MAQLVKISGVSNVIANIKKASVVIGGNIERGMIKGGLFLQRESQKIVPVDLNNLRPPAFTRNVGGTGFDVDVIVGYVADYAVYVHEDLEAKHKPGKTAKYLERPAREKRPEILMIIAKG